MFRFGLFLLLLAVSCYARIVKKSIEECIDRAGQAVAPGGTWERCAGLCCTKHCTCVENVIGGTFADCATMCSSMNLGGNCWLGTPYEDATRSNCCPVECADPCVHPQHGEIEAGTSKLNTNDEGVVETCECVLDNRTKQGNLQCRLYN